MGNRPEGLTRKAEEEKDFKESQVCRAADKSLAFPIFIFAAQPKEFFLDELKKL
jgi:hypothetical protein